MWKWERGDKLLLLILLSCVLQAAVLASNNKTRQTTEDIQANKIQELSNTIEAWKLERKVMIERYNEDHEEFTQAVKSMKKKSSYMDKFCDDAMKLLRQEVK